MAFKYRHGWIKIGGDDGGGHGGGHGSGGGRSADRLAAAAGGGSLGGKPGAKLGEGGHHIGDGSSHQGHAVDQVGSAHDTVIRMPGTDHELGNASMGPMAFQQSLEAHMDKVSPKAGEHIGVARANAKVGFYRAMTAAALIASIGPFGGHEAKGAELLQTGNHEAAAVVQHVAELLQTGGHEAAAVVQHVADTANTHNKIRFTGHPSTRGASAEMSLGGHGGGGEHAEGGHGGGGEHGGGGHEGGALPTDPGPSRNELEEGLRRQDRDPLRLADQPNEVGTSQLFKPRRKTVIH